MGLTSDGFATQNQFQVDQQQRAFNQQDEMASLTALARGGPAEARRPYLVGEKGPELMVPDQNGTIIPNNKLRKLQAILRKKKAVARAKGGTVEQGGAPPWPTAEDMVNMAPVVTPGVPVPAAPVPTGAADLAAAAAIQPPGFTPIRTSQGGSMTLGTNDLGVQEIRTNHPSWQLYQGAGKGADYPGAVANWHKEQDTHANDLVKAGLTAESHLEAARISKPYQHTEEGAQYLAQAELKRPDLAALAEKTKTDLAAQVGNDHVATLNNYLKNAHGAFVDNKVVFKPADEGMARDALASEQVAKTAGAPAAVNHFQERQAVRKYLGSPAMAAQLPKDFDSNAYIGAVSQNPAAWQELVTKGRALNVTQPPAPARRPWYETAAETAGSV